MASKHWFFFKKLFLPIFLVLLLVGLGITLLALPPTDCPSGCMYGTCRKGFYDYYPCQCGSYGSSNCADYEKSSSTLYSGISSLLIGVVYGGIYFFVSFRSNLREFREIGSGKEALI